MKTKLKKNTVKGVKAWAVYHTGIIGPIFNAVSHPKKPSESFGSAGSNGDSHPVHLPPTGENGYGEVVGCKCEKCSPPQTEEVEDWTDEIDDLLDKYKNRIMGFSIADYYSSEDIMTVKKEIIQKIFDLLSSNTERVKKVIEEARRLPPSSRNQVLDFIINNIK